MVAAATAVFDGSVTTPVIVPLTAWAKALGAKASAKNSNVTAAHFKECTPFSTR